MNKLNNKGEFLSLTVTIWIAAVSIVAPIVAHELGYKSVRDIFNDPLTDQVVLISSNKGGNFWAGYMK